MGQCTAIQRYLKKQVKYTAENCTGICVNPRPVILFLAWTLGFIAVFGLIYGAYRTISIMSDINDRQRVGHLRREKESSRNETEGPLASDRKALVQNDELIAKP